MEPRLLDVSVRPPDRGLMEDVAIHLRGGGLVAMPTETVYGFGCIAEEGPIGKIQKLKGRGPEKPFLVLIPEAGAVPALEWRAEALELARAFWPGALTLVLGDPLGTFPEGIRSPEGGVAVRVSPHPVARAVVESLGGPVVSTSANAQGGSPALVAEEVLSTARGLGAGADLWILDGGPLSPSDSSTIVDCLGPTPSVRRAGVIPINRIRCVLPEIHGPD